MTTFDPSRLKVLIIDDQAFIRRTIAMLLHQLGFKGFVEAEDGASGLEANKKHKPDLIICDIEMEPIDGLVFLQTLRQSADSHNADVPVIFLTQHSDSEIVQKALKLGVDSFIVKPPSAENLKKRIDAVLSLVSTEP